MKLLIITQKVDKNDQLLGFFIGWLERLAKKFDQVLVFCLEKGKFNLPKNVQVISLGKDQHLPKLAWLFNFYKYIFQYRRQYDAVLVHMNPIWMVLGGICWRLMDKKNYLWYTSGGVTAKLKLAEKLTHTIFTASEESFRVPSKKVIVTDHGIDTDLFRPDPNYQPRTINSQLRILSVGRIAPVKNYEVLIGAAKILHNEGMDISVTIIGEPALDKDKKYQEGLKFQINNLGLEGLFDFIGKVGHQDLPRYYQNHDLFVHLSKTGSVDKTLLEAMASGMNVLSSNESSRSFLPPEIIFNENDSEELADKIKKAKHAGIPYDLRAYVETHHNLDNLIEKVSRIIHEKNH